MSGKLFAAGLLAVSLAAGCGAKEPAGGGKGAAARAGEPRTPMQFPVETAPVEARDVQPVVTAVGSVEAFERVQITARVSGVVERVLFTEGSTVEKGAILAEIEPTRFALAVRSARAAYEKAQATRAEAEANLARREAVNAKSPGLLPAEEIETFRTRARTAAAEASAAKAALAQAELNLRDAYVRAPMAGTLQTRSVQTGQYVQPGTVLATLLRREPLLLRFTVPEPEAARLAPGLVARFTVRADEKPYEATLTHVAASADASRMVPVTAEVTGPGAKALRPGAFATVSVPVGTRQATPVVPQTAVRASERGFLAYVVQDGKAQERVLELGLRTPDGLVEVREGLSVGEQLVVRGAEALRDGAAVRVVGATPSPDTSARRTGATPGTR